MNRLSEWCWRDRPEEHPDASSLMVMGAVAVPMALISGWSVGSMDIVHWVMLGAGLILAIMGAASRYLGIDRRAVIGYTALAVTATGAVVVSIAERKPFFYPATTEPMGHESLPYFSFILGCVCVRESLTLEDIKAVPSRIHFGFGYLYIRGSLSLAAIPQPVMKQ